MTETAIAIPDSAPSQVAMIEADLQKQDLDMFEGISVRPTIWQFDAKDGVWRDTEDKETGLPILTGLIGGTWRSKVAFPPRKDSQFYPAEKDVWQELKWFCRARRDGAEPELNPHMEPPQRALALKLGAGKSCKSCPLGQWGANREKPRCTNFLNATWADQDTEQFGVVTVKTFSIKVLERHVSSFLKKRRLPCSQVSLLGARREQNDDGTFYVATAENHGEPLPPQDYARWIQAFRDMDPFLRSSLNFEHQDFSDDGARGNGASATGGNGQARQPDGDTSGLTLTDDGEVFQADPFDNLDPTEPPLSDEDFVPSAGSLPF